MKEYLPAFVLLVMAFVYVSYLNFIAWFLPDKFRAILQNTWPKKLKERSGFNKLWELVYNDVAIWVYKGILLAALVLIVRYLRKFVMNISFTRGMYSFVLILVIGYIAYNMWFDAEAFVDKYRVALKKAPTWYPFRNLYLRLLEKQSWIWLMRIGSTIGFSIAVIIFVSLIYQAVF